MAASSSSDYYDIDAIYASEVLAPVKITHGLTGGVHMGRHLWDARFGAACLPIWPPAVRCFACAALLCQRPANMPDSRFSCPAGAGCGTIIDPSSDSNDLSPGTVVEAPLWLIRSLAQRNMVQVGQALGPGPEGCMPGRLACRGGQGRGSWDVVLVRQS